MSDVDSKVIEDFLRKQQLFAALTQQDLELLVQMSRPISINEGDLLIEEGTPGDAMYVVLEGELEVTKKSGKQDVVLDIRKSGEMIGEISLLEQTPRIASVRALEKCRLLMISLQAFQHLLNCSPSAAMLIFRTVVLRLQNVQAALRQNEQMAALGTLVAGLAHELNNPAAAARRSSVQMRESLAAWQHLTVQLDSLDLAPEQTVELDGLREEMVKHAPPPSVQDPLARSDQESELEEWLDNHSVSEAWKWPPALMSVGFDLPRLEGLSRKFGVRELPVVIQWLATGCTVYAQLAEVGKSAERISELVDEIKSYSFLDQAPVLDVDIAKGLDDTLSILQNRLGADIKVIKEYAPDVPHIEAYASELNQVWTKIIDNALDAMAGAGSGELTLRIYKADDKKVVVEIGDTGTGIAPELEPRIFEPFVTTKPPGSGTGLGLNVAYNIVVFKHQGRITVDSKPGATTFTVTLPVQLKRG